MKRGSMAADLCSKDKETILVQADEEQIRAEMSSRIVGETEPGMSRRLFAGGIRAVV